MTLRIILPALVTVAASAMATAAALPAQPVAPVRTVSDTYFGIKVDDPYRYLEDRSNPEVQAWAKGQTAYTRATLDAIPARTSLLKRLQELDQSVTGAVTAVTRLPGDLYFYEKRGPHDDQFKLYVRHGIHGQEQLLVDPEQLAKATGKPHSINYVAPSPKGTYVAYGISEGGSEDASIHLMNVATRKELIAPISRAETASIGWANDEKSFFYNRLQEMKPGMPVTEKFRNGEMYVHTLDGKPDQLVLSSKLNKGIDIPADKFLAIQAIAGTGYATATVMDGVEPELSVYIAPITQVTKPDTPWRKLVDVSDQVTNLAIHGDDLYLITHKDAPRFKLIKTSVSQPDIANATPVMPPSSHVVADLTAAKDGLYVRTLDATLSHIYKLDYRKGAAPQLLNLPAQGAIAFQPADIRINGLVFELASWTAEARIFAWNPATQTASDTGLQPLSRWGKPEQLTSKEVMVKSYDGVEVPLSIVYPKSLKLDGKNPALLTAYGAYGITDDPYFLPRQLGWYEQGGVMATCHVRGGGAFGEEWHLAGKMKTKPNTWKDAIACGEYLIAQGYTDKAHLALDGGSAGGITVGRAMTERPDLFAVVVPQVGSLDTVRDEYFPNGGTNIGEFGSIKNEDEFPAILEMSSYAHVKNGTPYPAVLLTTGWNDPRVDPSNAMKMAARLQAATTSQRPVLLRVDYDAGHGIGSTKSQREQETADIWSFMLWQMGEPGFQPAP